MTELFVSRRAEAELRRIWHYIAVESPAAADRMLLRINGKLRSLRDFPSIGVLRHAIRPGFRMLVPRLPELNRAHRAIENGFPMCAMLRSTSIEPAQSRP